MSMFIYIFISYVQFMDLLISKRHLHNPQTGFYILLFLIKDCINVIVLFLLSVMDHRLFDFQLAAHQSFSVLIPGPAEVDASVKVTGLADL